MELGRNCTVYIGSGPYYVLCPLSKATLSFCWVFNQNSFLTYISRSETCFSSTSQALHDQVHLWAAQWRPLVSESEARLISQSGDIICTRDYHKYPKCSALTLLFHPFPHIRYWQHICINVIWYALVFKLFSRSSSEPWKWFIKGVIVQFIK